MAGAEGHMEMLEFLCDKTNYDFDVKDRWGNTAVSELYRKSISKSKKFEEMVKNREIKQF